MSEYNAFIAGLILGDSGGSNFSSPGKRGSMPQTNIPLQDVVFCQYLRNFIDELQHYIETKNPTPEEFIKLLMPDVPSYEEPYTEAERREIERHQEFIPRQIAEYVAENSNPEWYHLTAIQRIWKDPIHTPDFDHLDLLFHTGFCHLVAKPVKKDGRLYEYDEHTGVAKGFFPKSPSGHVWRICKCLTREFLKKQGIRYDYQREERGCAHDSYSCLAERKRVYRWLKKQSICKNPWSDMTREVKEEGLVPDIIPLFLALSGAMCSLVGFSVGSWIIGIVAALFATIGGFLFVNDLKENESVQQPVSHILLKSALFGVLGLIIVISIGLFLRYFWPSSVHCIFN